MEKRVSLSPFIFLIKINFPRNISLASSHLNVFSNYYWKLRKVLLLLFPWNINAKWHDRKSGFQFCYQSILSVLFLYKFLHNICQHFRESNETIICLWQHCFSLLKHLSFFFLFLSEIFFLIFLILCLMMTNLSLL